MTRLHLTACLAILVCVAADAREPVAESMHFAFYSDFSMNVHDALLAAGVARNSEREELFRSGEEQACFDALSPSQQAGWDLAVDFYARVIAPHSFNDRQQALLRLQLAEIDNALDASGQAFLDQAGHFIAAATPAYRTCRWERQDAANRAWIETMAGQLANYEATIAPRLAALYGVRWPAEAMDVDVVGTVSWAGANSFFARNSAGHLLVASSYAGHEALEILFHEASHGFMLSSAPLQQALKTAAGQLGVDVPPGLWHVILFVTTGETVRQVLDESGQPDYVPMIEEIYGRTSWGEYREAMEAIWPRYLDGKRGADSAVLSLIQKVTSD